MRRLPLTYDREAGPTPVIRALQYSADGRQLLVQYGDKQLTHNLIWWDLVEDRLIRNRLIGDAHINIWPNAVASADLSRVAFLNSDNRGPSQYIVLREYDNDSVKTRSCLGSRHRSFSQVALTADGSQLFAASDDSVPGSLSGTNRILLWDAVAAFQAIPGKPIPYQSDAFEIGSSASALACSGDGRWLAASGRVGQFKVWNLLRQRPEAKLAKPKVNYTTVARLTFSPDSRRLGVSVGIALIVWETDDWRLASTMPANGAADVAFTPDGTRLLAAERDGVHVYAADGHELRALAPFNGPARSVAIAPDGLTFAVGSTRGEVVLLDLDE